MLRLPSFRYARPESVEQALALALQGGQGTRAAFVAGGTDLLPAMKRRQHEPELIIAIGQLAELQGISAAPDGSLRIGAAVTLAQLAGDARVVARCCALAQAAGHVATPIIRNMATVGGNLCLDTRCNYYDQTLPWRQALGFCMKKDGDTCWVAPSSPRCWAVQSSDLAAVAVACEAQIELAGPDGRRRIVAEALYADDGIEHLTKAPDELVVALHLPQRANVETTYTKVARRGSFDFPVLGIAIAIRRDGGDAPIDAARIVLGAVAPAPLVAHDAGAALLGRKLDEQSIADAADAAWRKARPLDNTDLSLTWRKAVVRPYVARALRALCRDRGA